jgi:hypothetical protein
MVANLLLSVPATTDLSEWYTGTVLFVAAIPLFLAVWGTYTAQRIGPHGVTRSSTDPARAITR